MSDRPLSCYDYVNQPYARVRDAVLARPEELFARANAETLRVDLAGLELGVEIAISVARSAEVGGDAGDRPETALDLTWHAVAHPRLFPVMTARLRIYPLSPTETQIDLTGSYAPPLGKLGEVLDSAVGRRIGEAAVTRFVEHLAGWLRTELADNPAPAIA